MHTYIHAYIHTYILSLFFLPRGSSNKFLVFAPEVDR